MHVFVAALAALLPLASAVYLDEAYQIDFHYALLGQPQASSTFFHQPVKGSKASLLYSLSEKSVLGAVNPKDGAIVWRQVLSSNQSTVPGFLKAGEEQEALVSASGSHVTSWSAADGKLIWEKAFGSELVRSLVIDHSAQNDALVIVQGATSKVHKLDALTGRIKWTHEDTSGDTPHTILQSSNTAYFVTLHPALLKGQKLRVTSLDVESGKQTDQHTLNSDGDISTSKDILFAGQAAGRPIISWSDATKKTLKINILGTKDIRSFDTNANDLESIVLHASSRPNATPQFLAQYQTSNAHWADVFEIDQAKTNVRKIETFPKIQGRGVFSVAEADGKTFFVRLSETELSLSVPTSVAALASWPIASTTSSLDDKPMPVHATSEVVARAGSSYAVRAAVLYSSGDWVLIRNGVRSWVRPEALAGIVKAYWADASDKETLAQDLKTESSGNLMARFMHRTVRHLNGLKNFSSWIQGLLSPANIFPAASGVSAQSDAFGFSKLLIAETENGRSIALNMGQRGTILWNKPNVDQAAPHSHAESDANAHRRQPSEEVKYTLENGSLVGRRNSEEKTLWSFNPHPGYRILSVTPQLGFEPIASIGKVLGDRRVLYKYLNPNTVIVMSVDARNAKAIATLLDAVSGNVLYSSQHVNVDTSRPIATAISENWMSFSYTVSSGLDSVSKGFHLVMAEFYESDLPNDRGYFRIASNYSAIKGSSPSSKPHVIAQSFHVPEEISLMAVTQTGQGITSRQLIVSLSGSSSIVGIPSYAVDPRRIIGKDPSYAQQEEGLSRYAPLIDFDPTWYLNHQEEIVGVKKIMTTPSLLESTSLVVAFGHDIFGTRVSPSFAFDILGNNFNKIQLVLTVLALTIGVFIVAPLIQRKQTNALWQVV